MRETSAPRTSHNYYPIFRMEFLGILKFGGCQICIKTGFLWRSRFLEGGHLTFSQEGWLLRRAASSLVSAI